MKENKIELTDFLKNILKSTDINTFTSKFSVLNICNDKNDDIIYVGTDTMLLNQKINFKDILISIVNNSIDCINIPWTKERQILFDYAMKNVYIHNDLLEKNVLTNTKIN